VAASAAAYRTLLEALLGWHEPIEARLQAADWSETGLAIERRRKAELLADDLRALGADEAHIAALPRWTARPGILPDDAGSELGLLYVVEGSTLGAAHVARALAPRGIVPGRGGAFWSAYGDRTGAMWREVTELLARLPGDGPRAERAARAAAAAFDSLEDWLAVAGVLR
jgi:heme oxygenase